MPEFFERPIIRNPTRPWVGTDSPFIDTDELDRRVGGNTGNMVFLHAIRHQIKSIKHVSEGGGNRADVNILGSANQINKNMAKSGDDPLFGKSDAPFVSIGLGAQASSYDVEFELPEGTRDWLIALQARSPGAAPNISVRGEYTLNVLKKAGLGDKAVALGCPSLYISPFRDLGMRIAAKSIEPVRTVSVAPGNITRSVKRLDAIERSLADIVTEYGGAYIVQHPKSLVAMARGDFKSVEMDELRAIRDNIRPDDSMQDFERWFGHHACIFIDVPSWLEHHRSVDLVLSTRIHGTMTAINAGTPAVCVAIDSRQRELCELMRIPHILSEKVEEEGVTVEMAREVIAEHDWRAFDANRLDLAKRYEAFLNNNRLEASDHLKGLTGST